MDSNSKNLSAETKQSISSYDQAVLTRVFSPHLPNSELTDKREEVRDEVVAQSDVEKEARSLELQGVQLAEKGNVDGALDIFQAAIRCAPSWASSYNNMAQALRLKGDAQGAMKMLETAIQLSSGKGMAARQAYTQRGLIYRLEGDIEKAREDYQLAADLGSEFAQAELIALNPYAAMCNQMLAEAMVKLRTGET